MDGSGLGVDYQNPRPKDVGSWKVRNYGGQTDGHLHRQSMGNAVAITTFRGLHALGMGLPVAPAAQRNLAVARVTIRTGNRRVLRHLVLQRVIYVAVTTGTD